jgi:hypothetical protein
MTKNILFFLLISLFFPACKKIEKQISSGGKIIYNAENYALKNARCSNFGSESTSGLNAMNLFFAAHSITMNEDAISGTGAILAISTFSLSDTLPDGIYNVEDFVSEKNILKESSFFKIISKDDTLTVKISSGYMLIQNAPLLNKRFEFHFVTENGDSITGDFMGTVIYNSLYDKPAVAQFSVDTIDYQIQKGDFVSWGKLFSDSLFYYEIYFYSTNFRRTDAGKIKSGFVLTLGFNSLSENFPPNGTYAVSRKIENNTLLWGTKIANGRWGSYWNLYKNASVTANFNILSGNITFEKRENNFKIVLNLKDQNNSILGEYNNELNIKDFF